MRARFGWIFVGLMACTNAATTQDPVGPSPAPTPAPTPEPTPEPPAATTTTPPASKPPNLAAVTVEMTAATLADDCGGPPPASKAKEKSALHAKGDMARGAKMRRACEQSSMQLSVVAAAGGAATQLTVKKVELFDDKGAMIGELTARTPTVWDPNGTYQAWDQNVAPGQELAVSYALSQPPWASVPDRWDRTYVVKALIIIGSKERSVMREVHLEEPTHLPPNVKT